MESDTMSTGKSNVDEIDIHFSVRIIEQECCDLENVTKSKVHITSNSEHKLHLDYISFPLSFQIGEYFAH